MSASASKSKPTIAPGHNQYAPLSILDTDTARLYSHIHPVVVISGYLVQFRAIVANPVSTLTALLFPLIILQILYAVLCLPPTGTSTTPATPKAGASKGGRKKAAKKDDITLSQRIVPAILSLTLALFLGTPILTVLLILFGAPLTSNQRHTILCAAHISLLAILPLIYTHGLEKEKWMAITALMVPIDEIYGATLGALVGAWIGAVPIPLDWDRDWQKWPITVVTGAYIGWALGKFAGGTILRGRVIDLRE